MNLQVGLQYWSQLAGGGLCEGGGGSSVSEVFRISTLGGNAAPRPGEGGSIEGGSSGIHEDKFPPPPPPLSAPPLKPGKNSESAGALHNSSLCFLGSRGSSEASLRV